MALTQRLDLRQAQTLVMTPQLQQAIKLLQLSNLELTAYVENELERNPLLERDEAGGDTPVASDEPSPVEAAAVEAEPRDSADHTSDGVLPPEGEFPLDIGSESYGPNGDDGSDYGMLESGMAVGRGSGRTDFAEDENNVEDTVSRGITLRDHLLEQLGVEGLDPIDRIIGLHLIDAIDESGYLPADLSPIAETLGCPIERVEATLAIVQRFDPTGVFARSLSECLALQLKERNRWDPCIAKLIENLPLIASRDIDGLRRACNVDATELSEMIGEIRTLNPKPGSIFDREIMQPVAPDIMMRAQAGGGWIVELNNDTLPRVLVNTRYHSRIAREPLKRPEREYISERLQSANWLVKSLHQRATTILRVATEIVRQQDAFFLHGVQSLRPLILRDIAASIGMHESTISRVTTNKYMSTPRGIFELKYFFTSSIANSAGGIAHSAESVRHRIKTLIESESVEDVLSDDRIVEILMKEGVDIARRTVAKYREALRIPSSVQRRREKSYAF